MAKNKSLAKIKKNTIDKAESRIRELQENNEIDFPQDYSINNALKSAWLKLQETKTTNKKPVLQACSKTSIINAILDTVVQGLNPSKDQVYYIAYGNKLTAMRSYFGNMALAKRVANVKEINPEVIYEGDEVKIEVKNGKKYVDDHKTKWANQDDDKIAGGYAVVVFNDDRPDKHTIMTLDECKQAWKQGKTYGKYDGTPHDKFTGEMVKRTVINRATKPLIKSSTDSYLMKASIDRHADTSTAYEVDQEIEEEANTETIDITNESKNESKDDEEDEKMDNTKPLQEEEEKVDDKEIDYDEEEIDYGDIDI